MLSTELVKEVTPDQYDKVDDNADATLLTLSELASNEDKANIPIEEEDK